MRAFLDATSLDRLGPGKFSGEITDDWLQGRGAFGGLLLAAGLRAMQGEVGPDRSVRLVHALFAAPCVPGLVTFVVEQLRVGSRVTTLRGDFRQQGKTVCGLTVSFGTPAESKLDLSPCPSPDVPPWTSIEPIPWMPFMPVFTKHLEMRFAGGAAPYSGAAVAELSGYVGLAAGERTTVDAPLVAALLDAFPPVIIGLLDGPAPSSTLGLQYSFACDPARLDLDPALPFLVERHARFAHGGFADDHTSLFSADGRLVARGHQVVAVFA